MATNERVIGNPIAVKPYTLKELAVIYGWSPKVMRRRLKPFEKELGIKQGRDYSIPQVEIIFKQLKVPYLLRADESLMNPPMNPQ